MTNLSTHLMSRLRNILLTLIGIFRRALCCFSRRRRHSSSEFEQLDSIIVSNTGSSPSKHKNIVSTYSVVFL